MGRQCGAGTGIDSQRASPGRETRTPRRLFSQHHRANPRRPQTALLRRRGARQGGGVQHDVFGVYRHLPGQHGQFAASAAGAGRPAGHGHLHGVDDATARVRYAQSLARLREKLRHQARLDIFDGATQGNGCHTPQAGLFQRRPADRRRPGQPHRHGSRWQ